MTINFSDLRHKIAVVFSCSLFYFAVSIPFIDYLRLSPTTEVRPYCVLPFILSLVYGFPGVLGTALGNIFSDLYYGGMDNRIMAMGACFQIIYGYGGALLWKYLRRRSNNIFRLDKIHKITQYLLLVVLLSLIVTFMVWLTLHFYYGLNVFGVGFNNTLMNHMIFFVVLGIPFFVGYSYHLQKKKLSLQPTDMSNAYLFSLNEKFILFFVMISEIVSTVIAIFAYLFFRAYQIYDSVTLWAHIYVIGGATLYICLCPSLLILRSIERHISRPIEILSSIGKNFGEHEDIKSEIEHIQSTVSQFTSYKSEIGELALSFRTFSQKLNEFFLKLTSISKERTRVATQLRIAADIQKGALPEPIQLTEIDLYASMDPALEVGGDFYDYFRVGEHHLGFVIADVSDKGIPASLFMMISKTIIQKNMMDGMSPGPALTKSNAELCRNNRAEMFVTVFCGLLDLETGELKYASAGHDHPFISQNGEAFRIMNNKTGFVLGALEDIIYAENVIKLSKGDIFFMYTDGVPESSNEDKEQFGFERTLDVLSANRDRAMEDMCCALKESISQFKGFAKQFDDLTVLAIRMN